MRAAEPHARGCERSFEKIPSFADAPESVQSDTSGCLSASAHVVLAHDEDDVRGVRAVGDHDVHRPRRAGPCPRSRPICSSVLPSYFLSAGFTTLTIRIAARRRRSPGTGSPTSGSSRVDLGLHPRAHRRVLEPLDHAGRGRRRAPRAAGSRRASSGRRCTGTGRPRRRAPARAPPRGASAPRASGPSSAGRRSSGGRSGRGARASRAIAEHLVEALVDARRTPSAGA